MGLILRQTDNAVTFEVGCSGQLAGVTTAGRELVEGGTAGVNNVTVDPDNELEAAVFALATTGGVGEDTWEAGDYVVRLNISGSNGTNTWTETHICERTAGGAFNTVASLIGQTTDVSAPGVQTHTVNRATDFTPAGTDSDLFIVIVFSNADLHGNSSTDIAPDQNIDTPITVSVVGEGDGQSDGIGAAIGVGASIAQAAGASSGSATASAVGASTAQSNAASAGAATSTAIGAAITFARADGGAVGVSAAVGAGSSVAVAVGASAGLSVVAGDGKQIGPVPADGAAAGVALVSGVGERGGWLQLAPTVNTPWSEGSGALSGWTSASGAGANWSPDNAFPGAVPGCFRPGLGSPGVDGCNAPNAYIEEDPATSAWAA